MNKKFLGVMLAALLALPSCAQSRKQIIAQQKEQLEAQQSQIDSLKTAQQRFQEQIIQRMDSIASENAALRKQADSLSSRNQELTQQVTRLVQQEQEKQRAEEARKQNAANQQAAYLKKCAAQSDLYGFLHELSKTWYDVPSYEAASKKMIETYSEKCGAGSPASAEKILWQKSLEEASDLVTVKEGFSDCTTGGGMRYQDTTTFHRTNLKLYVECPDKKRYLVAPYVLRNRTYTVHHDWRYNDGKHYTETRVWSE